MVAAIGIKKGAPLAMKALSKGFTGIQKLAPIAGIGQAAPIVSQVLEKGPLKSIANVPMTALRKNVSSKSKSLLDDVEDFGSSLLN
jgi:hypothetical protein